MEQSLSLRASAAASASPSEKARFTHMADAYDALAARLTPGVQPKVHL